MSAENPTQIHATGEATGFIPAPDDKGRPITFIGTNVLIDRGVKHVTLRP